MGNVIASTEQMIEKINDVLKSKKNAVVNIVNDKLTLSVFALLEQNLKNVKEINFVIRDTKFVPEKSEISHEFEMAPADILYNSYDIVEKNKLKHFAKAKAMHDFIKANVNVKRANPKTKIGGNIIIIDDDFMIQGSSSLEVSPKKSKSSYRNINFDTMLNGTMDKDQILSALNIFNQIWFNDQVSSDYKGELLQACHLFIKNTLLNFCTIIPSTSCLDIK